MNKTIEQWREELQMLLKTESEKISQMIGECHEEIVLAFIAKYGLQPDKIITCYQDNKFWVEKRDETHIQNISEGRINSVVELFEKYKKLLEFVKIVNEGVSIPNNIEIAINHLFALAENANSVLKKIGEI